MQLQIDLFMLRAPSEHCRGFYVLPAVYKKENCANEKNKCCDHDCDRQRRIFLIPLFLYDIAAVIAKLTIVWNFLMTFIANHKNTSYFCTVFYFILPQKFRKCK